MYPVKRLIHAARIAAPLAALALIALAVVSLPAVGETARAPADRPAAPMPLTLRNSITVDGGSVRLSDIFDGFGPDRGGISGDTVVAYAPQPGRRAIFDANWLGRVAQRYGLNWRPTTRLDRVVVERASTIVDADDIAAALRDELATLGDTRNLELELSNRDLLVHIDASLPPTIEVVHLAAEARRGRFSAIVAIPAGDPQARRLKVAGRLHSVVEMPVPARALRPGSTIGADDIEWKRVRAEHVRSDIVTDPGEIIGQEAKRPLGADTLVRRSDLREPVAVAKGMVVTMVFQTASMLLTASGRALEAGAVGDIITVRNTQTKAIVDARILGPNRVEVAAPQQLALSEGKAQ